MLKRRSKVIGEMQGREVSEATALFLISISQLIRKSC
jgi:hypothetical protein